MDLNRRFKYLIFHLFSYGFYRQLYNNMVKLRKRSLTYDKPDGRASLFSERKEGRREGRLIKILEKPSSHQRPFLLKIVKGKGTVCLLCSFNHQLNIYITYYKHILHNSETNENYSWIYLRYFYRTILNRNLFNRNVYRPVLRQ